MGVGGGGGAQSRVFVRCRILQVCKLKPIVEPGPGGGPLACWRVSNGYDEALLKREGVVGDAEITIGLIAVKTALVVHERERWRKWELIDLVQAPKGIERNVKSRSGLVIEVHAHFGS